MSMNIPGILSVLGLDIKGYLAGLAGAETATEKFVKDTADSATAAGKELQSVSDGLKDSFQGMDLAALNAGINGVTEGLQSLSRASLASFRETSDATEEFAQNIVDSATTAEDKLVALSDRIKEARFNPEVTRLSGEDLAAGIEAGMLVGPEMEFKEYVRGVEEGYDKIGASAEMAAETVGTAAEKGADTASKAAEKAADTASKAAEKAAKAAEKSAKDFANNFIKGMELAKNALMTFVTSYPLIEVIKHAAEAIFGFDAALVNMQAHTLLSAEVIQRLGEYASFATDNLSQFHELDAVAGLQMLARTGQDVVTAMGNLPAVLDLAAVAGMDVASAADIVATTMNQFSMSTLDAARVADVFTKASQTSRADIGELASMMRYIAATMDGAGYSFEQTTTYVTAFVSAGMIARQAAGALSTAVESLANMSTEGQEVLDRYGVALKNAAGKAKPLVDVVVELKSAGASTTDMLTVFGASSQKITTILANLGKDGFDKLLKGLEDSKGAANAAAGILQTSLASSLKTVHKSLADIWLSLGKDMKPALQWFMSAINGLINPVKKAVQGIEEWSTAQKVLAGTFVGLAAAIVPLVTLVGTFKAAIVLLHAKLLLLGVPLGPFYLIALAVAALTAVVLAGITAWIDYQNVMNPIYEGLPTGANVVKAKAKLAQFDKDTAEAGQAYGGQFSGVGASDAYLTDRANQRVALAKDVNDRIAASRGAAQNEEAKRIQGDIDNQANGAKEKLKIAQGLEDDIYRLKHTAYQSSLLDIKRKAEAYTAELKKSNYSDAEIAIKIADYRNAAIANLDKTTAASAAKLSEAASKKSQGTADAALKKAQETADAIAQANEVLANKNYELTHTEVENQLHAIDLEAAADREAGANAKAVAQWVKDSKAVIYKKGADDIKAINQTLTDELYTLSHTDVENSLHDIDVKAAAEKAAGANSVLLARDVALQKKAIYAEEMRNYQDEMKNYSQLQGNVRSALTQYITDNYNFEKTSAVNALNAAHDRTVDTLNDMITKRQDALSSTLDAISEGKTAAIDALNNERDAAVNALNDMVDARQDELSSTLDTLSTKKDAAVDAVEKERDATLNALDDMITARQNEMNSTLDAISQEKDAVLGQYDAQIQALQDANAVVQDENTIAVLQAEIAAARVAVNDTKTYEDRAVAQEVLNKAKTALDKEMYTESYNAQLSSLQKQRKAASDTYDAQKTAAQKSGDAEIQQLKDTLAVTKTSYADRLTTMKAYYDAETTATKKSGDIEIQSLKDTLAATQTSFVARLVSANTYWDALTTATTAAGNAEIQRLKDSLAAVQKSYNDQLAAINIYYDQKLATANINADAEELLATKTSDEILEMLQGKLSDYELLGAQYGNALYGDAIALQAQLLLLQNAIVPVAPATVQVQSNGMAPAGQSVGTIVATAGGNYQITGVNQATPSGYTSVPVATTVPAATIIPPLLGGGSGRMLMTHAEGGYFTTPHVGMIAEKGPEFVVPLDQAASFASKMGGSDSLLRQLLLKVDTLTFAVRQVAPGVGSAVNGLGRV